MTRRTGKLHTLKVMDFAKVTSNKVAKGTGLELGSEVIVASTEQHQAKKSDPYLLRTYVVCMKVDDGKIVYPNMNNKDKELYRMDPRSLEWVGEERQKELSTLNVEVA